jgi:23S rRNA (pseudouridine1915-N3)-methyltransferase
MLNITILCVGGLKEAFWKSACTEYCKRLSAWAKINLIEIEEARLPDDPTPALIKAALASETEKILKKLPTNAFVTALCIEGKQLDSEEFAQVLASRMQSNGNFAFIIGGSYGLAQQIKEKAHLKLSFSVMTFPHMIARVLLFEQLYRAMHIINGGKYHK